MPEDSASTRTPQGENTHPKSQVSQPKPQKRTGFLDLPAELRLKIYTLILSRHPVKHPLQIPRDATRCLERDYYHRAITSGTAPPTPASRAADLAYWRRRRNPPALFEASRQVYLESSEAFYAQTPVRIAFGDQNNLWWCQGHRWLGLVRHLVVRMELEWQYLAHAEDSLIFFVALLVRSGARLRSLRLEVLDSMVFWCRAYLLPLRVEGPITLVVSWVAGMNAPGAQKKYEGVLVELKDWCESEEDFDDALNRYPAWKERVTVD